jgi:hypothetical protein
MCTKKEGHAVALVTARMWSRSFIVVVTNLTPRPSFFASITLVRMVITVLSPEKSDKNVGYLPVREQG